MSNMKIKKMPREVWAWDLFGFTRNSLDPRCWYFRLWFIYITNEPVE